MLTFANISQLCRICLRHLRQITDQQHSTNDNHQRQSSFNPKTLPNLAQLLNQFFAIDVFQQPDTFPQNICSLCYNAIEYFQTLCTVAEQSNEMLERLKISQDVDDPEPPMEAKVAETDDADNYLVGIYTCLQLSQLEG